jgi:hypothetical protein
VKEERERAAAVVVVKRNGDLDGKCVCGERERGENERGKRERK